ncbi:MAG: ABC transporter ATP-binding protein [Sphaerochaetaceae bacterium]|jgi:lipoprotein-releasing system ATP-binding protein
MSNLLLQLSHISKRFASANQTIDVLEDLNLSIYEGTSVAITGKSGSGKSTLLHIAGALDAPSGGEVYFKGILLDYYDDQLLSEYRNRHIGFIFQSHFLLDDFSALENVFIPSLIAKEKRSIMVKRAKELLDKVGLSSRLHHKPFQLSGGEKQRVAICRALMNNPSLIIADEPTGSLDEQTAQEIEQLLIQLVREEHKTLLLVTHEKQLATLCDTSYLLSNGRVTPIDE